MKGPATTPGTVPVGPLLSMYDPIYVGVDEFGAPVYTRLDLPATCSRQANPAAANPGC